MSNYSVYPKKDSDFDINVGYDEGTFSFFVRVESHKKDKNGNDVYLFHPINNVPGVRMTISQIDNVVSRFGAKLEGEIVFNLLQDAQSCGYIEYLKNNDLNQEHVDFVKYLRAAAEAAD